MRDLKFRGKRSDNKEWITGSLINYHPDKNPRIVFSDFTDGEIPDYIERNFEVLLATICRYTGAKDGNGADVFEGDFVVIDKTALNKEFQYSNAGTLMKERDLDSLIIAIEISEKLQVLSKTYLIKDGKTLSQNEFYQFTEEDLENMSISDREYGEKPYYESSINIRFLNYIAQYGFVSSNIFDSPEMLK